MEMQKETDKSELYVIEYTDIEFEGLQNCVKQVYSQGGVTHRGQDLPAVIIKAPWGDILQNEYYEHGLLDRKGDKPARVTNHFSGDISHEFYENNVCHRDGKPAIIEMTSEGRVFEEEYVDRGRQHRLDGASSTSWDIDSGILIGRNFKQYGLYNREEAPAAEIYSEVTGLLMMEGWYKNDEPFRADGGGYLCIL